MTRVNPEEPTMKKRREEAELQTIGGRDQEDKWITKERDLYDDEGA